MDVVFRGTKDELLGKLRDLPGLLSGRVADPTGQVRSLLLRLGVSALGLVLQNFVDKSRGGSGVDGEPWQPLAPSTVAYKRRHPQLQRRRKLAAKTGRERRPLLSLGQDRLWRRIFAREMRGRDPDDRVAKARAAKIAWVQVKLAGGKTILAEYGHKEHEILRDTGQLKASLTPGTGETAAHPEQILEASPGMVTVGTRRKGAAAHHLGVPGRLPQRRLWPPVSKWPDAWWQELSRQLRKGVEDVLERFVT